MSIELTKGERFNLSQEVPNFNKLTIALGWQVSQTAQNCDIDASVFMLAAGGRIPDEKYFVFYNNPELAQQHYTIAHQLCTQLGALKEIEKLELRMKN